MSWMGPAFFKLGWIEDEGFFKWVGWGWLFHMSWMGPAFFKLGWMGTAFSSGLNWERSFFDWIEWKRDFSIELNENLTVLYELYENDFLMYCTLNEKDFFRWVEWGRSFHIDWRRTAISIDLNVNDFFKWVEMGTGFFI
jgi:hypothetical protein